MSLVSTAHMLNHTFIGLATLDIKVSTSVFLAIFLSSTLECEFESYSVHCAIVCDGVRLKR